MKEKVKKGSFIWSSTIQYYPATIRGRGIETKEMEKLRIAKGWSQRKLADTANVPYTSVNGFERGNRVPNLNTLYAIAYALEVDIKELL
jgi:DNA-binding XRE family transcriptional regulator